MTHTAKRKAPKAFNENPAWGAKEFAEAVPLSEADPRIAAAFKRARGRPQSETPKEVVSIRLDTSAVAAFRKTGKGWQARLNAVVVKAAKRIPKKAGANA